MAQIGPFLPLEGPSEPDCGCLDPWRSPRPLLARFRPPGFEGPEAGHRPKPAKTAQLAIFSRLICGPKLTFKPRPDRRYLSISGRGTIQKNLPQPYNISSNIALSNSFYFYYMLPRIGGPYIRDPYMRGTIYKRHLIVRGYYG